MAKDPKVKTAKKTKRVSNVKRSVGLFTFQFLTGALLLGFIGWWGYTQIMKMSLGRFNLFSMASYSFVEDEEQKILLLNPLRTERFLLPDSLDPDYDWPYTPRVITWPYADTLWYAEGLAEPDDDKDNEWYDMVNRTDDRVHASDYWEKFLFKKDIPYEVIYESELTNIYRGYSVLILPGPLLLSANEKRGIKDFLMNGGSVLMCWSPGCRDENGDWVGFHFMTQLIGGTPARTIQDPCGGTSVIMKNDTPITATVSPGSHLDMFTYNGGITLNLIEGRTKSAGFWFEPYWKKGLIDPARNNCAAAYGTYLNGKFAWFSFMPEAIQENKDNNIVLDRIFDRSLQWLQNKPVVRPKVWPRGFKSGGSLVLRLRGPEQNIDFIIESCRSAGIDLDLVVEDEFVGKTIIADNPTKGDIILSNQGRYNLAGRPIKEQKNWIDNQIRWIKGVSGRRPDGLFPAYWRYDQVTLEAAAKNDLRFMLSNPIPRYYGPAVQDIRAGGLRWLIAGKVQVKSAPKSALSVDEWVEAGYRGEEQLYRKMVEDMIRIQRTGGIYIGILDPITIEEQKAYNLPIRLAQKMDSLMVWRTETSDLLARFAAWKNIRVSTRPVSQTRLMISVSNEGRFSIKDVDLEIFLPGDIDHVTMSSELLGYTPTRVQWDRELGICSFTLPSIGARDNASIFLDKVGKLEFDL